MCKKYFVLTTIALLTAAILTSCATKNYMVVPRSVSTATAMSANSLNLQKGQYDILESVTETASVIAEYHNKEMKITSGDGDFSYVFKFDDKKGWSLKSFNGVAQFGYLMSDTGEMPAMPEAEEFARRVAIARLINQLKDYNADGALEPIVTTRASNIGKNKVEFTATATAKIVKIHNTTK